MAWGLPWNQAVDTHNDKVSCISSRSIMTPCSFMIDSSRIFSSHSISNSIQRLICYVRMGWDISHGTTRCNENILDTWLGDLTRDKQRIDTSCIFHHEVERRPWLAWNFVMKMGRYFVSHSRFLSLLWGFSSLKSFLPVIPTNLTSTVGEAWWRCQDHVYRNSRATAMKQGPTICLRILWLKK